MLPYLSSFSVFLSAVNHNIFSSICVNLDNDILSISVNDLDLTNFACLSHLKFYLDLSLADLIPNIKSW